MGGKGKDNSLRRQHRHDDHEHDHDDDCQHSSDDDDDGGGEQDANDATVKTARKVKSRREKKGRNAYEKVPKGGGTQTVVVKPSGV